MAKDEREYKIDLKDHLEKYAWRKFREGHPVKHFFTRKSQYYVDIRWGFVEFQHRLVSFDERKDGDGRPKKHGVELYVSDYENRTEKDQTYTFETSRQTESRTSVQFEESYTIGASTNLEVDLGGVVKLGAAVEGSKTVTNTDTQEFSKTVSWNANTEITVQAGYKITAKLTVEEETTINDFEIETIVRLPRERLPISIRRISDDKVIDSRIIGKLSIVFEKEYLEKNSSLIRVDTSVDENQKKWTFLVLKTRGICKSRSFHNQNVFVTSTKLDGVEIAQPITEEKEKSGKTSEDDHEADKADEQDATEAGPSGEPKTKMICKISD